MTTALATNTPPVAQRLRPPAWYSARLAIYGESGRPPEIRDVQAASRPVLVERLFEAVAAAARVPVLALREIVENLIHADFEGALVSVMDGGAVVRVSDHGPGIADKALACQHGFTTAGPATRECVRGVGSGLPLAAEILSGAGGSLDITDNLQRGTVATLVATRDDETPSEPATVTSDARHLLALLLELGSASPDVLSDELGVGLCACGRELCYLEHCGLVARAADGQRTLTPRGSELITSLF